MNKLDTRLRIENELLLSDTAKASLETHSKEETTMISTTATSTTTKTIVSFGNSFDNRDVMNTTGLMNSSGSPSLDVLGDVGIEVRYA